MSFDGLFTRAVINELKEKLVGGRVSKVHQPFANELILRIRANRKNQQLLLSAHPQYARMQLTELQFENPKQPPQFCMVLRKYIEGSTLIDIQQIENDRVVELIFTGRDELGDEQNYHLIIEIMGRHSNILLVNKSNHKIYEAIRHIPPSLNSYRTLLPGADYRPAPSQDSVNPFIYKEEISIEGSNTKELVQSIQSQFQGFGRDSAKELLLKLREQPERNQTEIFNEFLQPYRDHEYTPVLTNNPDNNKTYFNALPYESVAGERYKYETFMELLDEYYEDKANRDRVRQQSNDLIQLLKNERDKNVNKLIKLGKENEQTEEAEVFRAQGEILTAYMHMVEQGMEEIELENFYENNEPIVITLDPQKAPAANAQWYFSQYQKLKSRKKHLAQQIPLTKQEIDYIDSVSSQLEIANSQDIEDIRDELRDEGYLKKQKRNVKKKNSVSKPEKFVSTDGDIILVGKNNKQNDQLTMRMANKTDWWLHTKDIPGSHVVIRNDNPSEQTIEEAAILAAYNSKYRMSSSVPVDYTQIKHVNKPNGAKPGFVIYDNQSTVFVTPHKSIIKELKQNVTK